MFERVDNGDSGQRGDEQDSGVVRVEAELHDG